MKRPTVPYSPPADILKLDSQDPLNRFRDEFRVTDPDLIYFDGNSLGRMAVRSQGAVERTLSEEWGAGLIRSWNTGWYDAPARIGDKIGRLTGAAPGQVVVTDSTSVNLYKLAMGALSLQKGRSVIVSDDLNFPTDLYILQGCAQVMGNGITLRLVHSRDGISIDLDDLLAQIDDQTALVSLSHVVYKSGFLYDMQAVTEAAHRAGALVLWDLSHSVGAVPVELDDWGVDLAVGCTYKYLNGGPGSPAFLYVRKDLQDKIVSPIWGWFGQQSPFAFDLEYTPAQGIRRFLAGSPPILGLQSLEAALELPLSAGIDSIRTKSEALTALAVDLFDRLLEPQGFTLGSPRDPARRGSHISIRHPEGYRINRSLIEEMNLIPDFREPDFIRLGFAPLYTTFEEVWRGMNRIHQVVAEGRYLAISANRTVVT